ncbi:hypothetical protein E4U59_003131 [Claviceps monticola]|nr:hypothetical protein E4U59_003131 [Claviceps monticola]
MSYANDMRAFIGILERRVYGPKIGVCDGKSQRRTDFPQAAFGLAPPDEDNSEVHQHTDGERDQSSHHPQYPQHRNWTGTHGSDGARGMDGKFRDVAKF